MSYESLIERGEALAAEAESELNALDKQITQLQDRRKQVARMAKNFRDTLSTETKRRPRSPANPKNRRQHAETLLTLGHAILEHGGEDPFTVQDAASWSGVHKTTVRKSLSELQEIGLVRLDRGSGGKGQPALFKVLDRQAVSHLNGGVPNAA